MPWVSYVITFLVGMATGAAGQYFGAKFTDQRRKQESRKESRLQFEHVRAQMPELIAEMKKDLTEDGRSTIRDFFISERNIAITLGAGETRFAYYVDDHQNLRSKVTVLENHGYINLIESGYTPTYRMTERFVAFIVQ